MAVAIVHGGKTVYAKGFGVKDTSKGDAADNKVDADTVFQLASMSKSVGATVVAHEVTSNVVSWDTPVVSKLPWFALSDPYVTSHVTIADLYSHRSGLPDHAGDQLEDLDYDRRQTLERMRHLPLAPFRISYAYTNFGLTAAAEAVAAAAGKSWEDLSDEVLYHPLGMASTSSRFADFVARPNHAVNHVKVGDKWEPRFQRDPDPAVAGGRGEFVGQRHGPLADDAAGQRNVQRPADHLAGGPAARHHPAGRFGARRRTRRRGPVSTATASPCR